jgi:hypothetical protein
MKADFDVTPYTVVAIILFIIVLTYFVNMLFVEKVQAANYVPPTEKVECKTGADCDSTNPICISINGQPNFCGCLTDKPDCESTGKKCIYNKCKNALT